MSTDTRNRRPRSEEGGDLQEHVVQINRVAKVMSGGRRFNFSTTVVVGDGKGRVGVGIGKANEVPDSIRKGVDVARKSMIEVPLEGRTIPHEVEVKYGGARVMMRPAAPGTGLVAGGGVRAVVEAAGIHDILAKSLGSANPVNVTKAAIKALSQLESADSVAARRGVSVQRLRPSKQETE